MEQSDAVAKVTTGWRGVRLGGCGRDGLLSAYMARRDVNYDRPLVVKVVTGWLRYRQFFTGGGGITARMICISQTNCKYIITYMCMLLVPPDRHTGAHSQEAEQGYRGPGNHLASQVATAICSPCLQFRARADKRSFNTSEQVIYRALSLHSYFIPASHSRSHLPRWLPEGGFNALI